MERKPKEVEKGQNYFNTATPDLPILHSTYRASKNIGAGQTEKKEKHWSYSYYSVAFSNMCNYVI